MIEINDLAEIYTKIRNNDQAMEFFQIVSTLISTNEVSETFFDDIHEIMKNNEYLYNGFFAWIAQPRNHNYHNALFVINEIICSDIPAIEKGIVDEAKSKIRFFEPLPVCNLILNFKGKPGTNEYLINGTGIKGIWIDDYFAVTEISFSKVKPKDFLKSISFVDTENYSTLLIYCSMPIHRKRIYGVECFNLINSNSY